MRKTYPSTSYHIPSPGRQAIPSPQMGQRMSLLALQEELQLQTRHGLVDTHRLRIIRIEQSAMLSDPLPLPRPPFQEPVPVSAQLAADPGLYLKLPWARVKSELAPHLQHPETLRDHDVLECCAQIYEAQRTLPAAQLAALALGDAALAPQLHPLTQAKAQMLGAPPLFKPPREPFETHATSRQIYTGQRVYRLWLVFDPTGDRDTRSGGPSGTSANQGALRRHEIPKQYLHPLQFQFSREEALYDMRGLLGTLPPESGALMRWLVVYPLRLLKTLSVAATSGRRMKKWRTMLQGQSLDDQLWAVTPPRGFSYHPAVRRWAGETLTRARYDFGRMYVEWEIFWRRKGQ